MQIPQERVHSNTVEQIVTGQNPRIRKEIGELSQLVLQDRISGRNGEQFVDAPVQRIQEQIVEVMTVMPHTQAKDPAVQVAQKTVKIPQTAMTQTMDGILNASAQDMSTGRSDEIGTTNQEGRLCHTEADCMVQNAESYRDKPR